MTEILWNTNAPHSPLRDHELVELRLVDLGGPATVEEAAHRLEPQLLRVLALSAAHGG